MCNAHQFAFPGYLPTGLMVTAGTSEARLGEAAGGCAGGSPLVAALGEPGSSWSLLATPGGPGCSGCCL